VNSAENRMKQSVREKERGGGVKGERGREREKDDGNRPLSAAFAHQALNGGLSFLCRNERKRENGREREWERKRIRKEG